MTWQARVAGGLPVLRRCLLGVGLLVWLGSAAAAADLAIVALPDLPFVFPRPLADVTTQLYNNARQGANLAETSLNPVSVGGTYPDGMRGPRFGKLGQKMLLGQVLAQPLYVHDVDVTGLGRRDLLIVATAANVVYALDPIDLGILFYRRLSTDVVPVGNNPGRGITNSLVPLCAETFPPYIGVTSTPVIDPASGTVYVESFDPITARQELHALQLGDRFTSDRKSAIQPRGESADWPKRHRNRAGLLLSQGVVYVAFSSFICDHPEPYQGWVFGFDARELRQVAEWRTHVSPAGDQAGSSGIWQSGRGLVASAAGDIYFMTGNDNHFAELRDHTRDPGEFHDPRLANSFVKLTPGGLNGLTLNGSFTPKNSSQLSAGDTDLGSSGPILLPGNRLAGGGKQGRVYLLDGDTMHSLEDGDDGAEGIQAFHNRLHASSPIVPGQKSCLDGVVAGNPEAFCRQLHNEDLLLNKCPYPEAPLAAVQNHSVLTDPTICWLPVSCYQYCQAYGPNIHAGFAYWQNAAGYGMLYAMPEKEHVEAFRYDLGNKRISETPVASFDAGLPDGMPGGALSVSANGTEDGIVWVAMPNQEDATGGIHRGSVLALDANDLHQLWADNCIFWFAKFNPPIVVDGRVYLATFADPVDPVQHPEQVVAPGPLTPDGKCEGPDPLLPGDFGNPDPNFRLPVGVSWIISYGLQ